jgi:hypothetical protein
MIPLPNTIPVSVLDQLTEEIETLHRVVHDVQQENADLRDLLNLLLAEPKREHWSASETARLTNITPQAVCELCKRRKLAGKPVGIFNEDSGRWEIFPEAWLADWIARHGSKKLPAGLARALADLEGSER